MIDGKTIGRVHGAAEQTYTAGVVCAKVARYAERIHHPDRLTQPLRRTGPKGSGQFERDLLGRGARPIGREFLAAEREYGAESVWPYYYAGTMGLVMRDGIKRLTPRQEIFAASTRTICINLAWPGFIAGTGKMRRPRSARDGEVRLRRDLGHQRRRDAGQRDDPRDPRPQGARRQDRRHRHLRQRHDAAGRSGAVPAARHRRRARLRGHARAVSRRPRRPRLSRALHRRAAANSRRISRRARREWAAAITGLPVAEIEAFAALVGRDEAHLSSASATAFRASATAPPTCTRPPASPAVTGAWPHEGGGAFHNNGAIYHWNKTADRGPRRRDASVRMLDQSPHRRRS